MSPTDETHPDMPTRARRHLTPLLLTAGAVGVLSLAGVVGTQHLDGVDQRLARIEAGLARAPRAREVLESGFAAELDAVRAELDAVRDDLVRTQGEKERAERLALRLAGAETRLSNLSAAVDAHGSSLAELSEASIELAPTFEERLHEQAAEMEALWESLQASVDDTRDLARRSAERVEGLSERDVTRMWNELVGPTVQLAGEESVGSGVILRSRTQAPEPGAVEASTGGQVNFDTYVMTAWHVVRDIVLGDLEKPVPVAIYAPDGSVSSETASLLLHDAKRDIALLLLDTDAPVAHGAELASPERLSSARIFDEVYAVGCPLGNDPIPTPGELATRRHVVDGTNYWMINAPTYIGNSGGGIFDAETHELLGIFSKIYTHGTLRPTIVPHMGLVTPLDDVYPWLEQNGYGFLVPKAL